MKNTRRFLLPIFLMMVLALSVMFTGCDKEDKACKEGNHTWGEWSVTTNAGCATEGSQSRKCTNCEATEQQAIPATGHSYGEWKNNTGSCTGGEERVCAGCGNKETRGGTGSHSFGAWEITLPTCTEDGTRKRTCTACGEVEIGEGYKSSGHLPGFICLACGHTEGGSIGLKLTDVTIEMYDDAWAEERGVATIELAEFYVALDADHNITGYGYADIAASGTHTGVNSTSRVEVFLEDGKLYAIMVGTPEFSNKESASSAFTVIDLEKDLANNEQLAEIIAALEQYDAMMETYRETLEELIPQLEVWYTEFFVPVFENMGKIEGVAATAGDVATTPTFTELFFTTEVLDDGSMVTRLDLSVIKEFNEYLQTAKLSEVIESVIGEGALAEIEAAIPTILDYNVGMLLNFIGSQGIDLRALFTSLDKLVEIVTEGQFKSLAELMELPEGTDLYAIITSDDIKGLAVIDAIMAIASSMTPPMPPVNDDGNVVEKTESVSADVDEDPRAAFRAEILATCAKIFDMLEAATIYDLLPEEVAPEMVDGMVDIVSAAVSLEITTATDGNVAIDVSLDLAPVLAISMDGGNIPTMTVDLAIDKDGAEVILNLENEGIADVLVMATADADGVTVEAAIETSEVKVDATASLIPGYEIKNISRAKLDEWKALAKPVTVTEELLEALSDEWITYDPIMGSDGVTIIGVTVTRTSQGWYGENLRYGKIGYDLYFDDISTFNYYDGVGGGCNSICLSVDARIIWNVYVVDENDEFVKMADEWYYDYVYAEIFINKTTGEVTVDGGHDFQLVDSKSKEAEGCEGIGYNYYECACGANKTYYYTNGHNHAYVETPLGNTCEDGIHVKEYCDDCKKVFYDEIEYYECEVLVYDRLYEYSGFCGSHEFQISGCIKCGNGKTVVGNPTAGFGEVVYDNDVEQHLCYGCNLTVLVEKEYVSENEDGTWVVVITYTVGHIHAEGIEVIDEATRTDYYHPAPEA